MRHSEEAHQISFDLPNEASNPTKGPHVLLLTNRFNLLEFLSSGFVKPIDTYVKSYADLGANCPAGIPLLLKTPPKEIVVAMSEAEPIAFPVLLDIELALPIGPVLLVDAAYNVVETADFTWETDAVCLVMQGVIPLDRVRQVYFRNEQELREHELRQYDNIRAKSVLLYVAPERFDGPTIEMERMLTALTEANDRLPGLDLARIRRAEAAGGALLMVSGLANHLPGFTLADLVPALQALAGSTQHAESSEGSLARFLTQITDLTDHTANEKAGAVGNLDQAEALLFSIALQELALVTASDFYNADCLEQIRVKFLAELQNRGADASFVTGFAQLLEDAARVLGDQKTVDDFPREQSQVVTALLLFLMRNGPVQVVSWLNERFQVTPNVAMMMVALSGALYGRAQIPVDSRPSVDMERFIDSGIATRLNQTASGASDRQLQFYSEANSGVTMIKYGTSVLIERIDAVTLPSTYGLPGEALPFQEVSVVERLLKSDLTAEADKNAALYLCRAAKWDDCVTSIIPLARRKYVMTNSIGNGEAQLRISGFIAAPEIEVRPKEFRAKLGEASWDRVPEGVRQRTGDLLNGATVEEKAPARPKRKSSVKTGKKDAGVTAMGNLE